MKRLKNKRYNKKCFFRYDKIRKGLNLSWHKFIPEFKLAANV